VEEIIKAVQEQGITVVMAVGMGYFHILYLEIRHPRNFTSIRKSNYEQLSDLIDRIRMLDNDMIRMDQKINTILELRDIEKEKKDE
jgi:hypothetical protein